MARESPSLLLQRHHRILTGLFRAGFVLSVLAVCVLSLLPAEELPRTRPWDKISHLIAYLEIAVLGLLGYRGPRAGRAVAVGVVALGGILELAQQAVPGRASDLADFLVNALGVVLGYGIARLLLRIWPVERGTGPTRP
jgi:VanZ family protein